MRVSLKFWFFRHYWWLLLLVSAIMIVVLGRNLEGVITVIGVALSVVFFLQKQRLEEIRLFREIFADCNARYDELNEDLNAIVSGPQDENLTQEQRDTLMDYFNLCGEEFLYYRQGYLYPEVWQAWLNGMKVFFKNPRIAVVWSNEKESKSYYGLEHETALNPETSQ